MGTTGRARTMPDIASTWRGVRLSRILIGTRRIAPAVSSSRRPRARRPSTNTSTRANSSTAAARRKANSNRSPESTTSRRPESCYVSVPGSPGIIAKFNKNGTPANFSALNNGAGRDYIDLGSRRSGEVSVDTSNNPSTQGNVYLQPGHLLRLSPERAGDRTRLHVPKFGGASQPGVEASSAAAARRRTRTANTGISPTATASRRSTCAISTPSSRSHLPDRGHVRPPDDVQH